MNTAIDIPVELAKHIGDTINVDWRYTNLEQFRQGGSRTRTWTSE